jgi:putative phosphoesterase
MNIGLLSDTHGYLDDQIFDYFAECDEIWHAGDIGTIEVANQLLDFKKFKAVQGNIDDSVIRYSYPLEHIFVINGVKVYMTHIGGYPPKYSHSIRIKLDKIKPDLFICGHSHIVKIIMDNERRLLHINPGAAGMQGIHLKRNIVRFKIAEGKIKNLQLIDLGGRG